jgi:peroxidase
MGLATLTMSWWIFMFLTLMNLTLPVSTQSLQVGFYDDKCSTAETVIREVVEAKYNADKTIVPGLLRMYFHDCFVQVCEWPICPGDLGE